MINKHNPSEIHIDNKKAKHLAQSDTKVKSDFQLMGKIVMISLMKSQFEYFTDLDVKPSEFAYNHLDKNAERLEYLDDYDNIHDLYHGIVGGKEVCLYHVNDGRNRSIDIPKGKSVMQSLKKYQKEINDHPKANNLENQRTPRER